jgi:hypothetical protein
VGATGEKKRERRIIYEGNETEACFSFAALGSDSWS